MAPEREASVMMRGVGYTWPTWEEWLAGQDEQTRERALALEEKFRRSGCADPGEWVRSEIDEDFAQLARFIFLRLIWDQQLQPLRDQQALQEIPLAKELIDGGTDPEKLWRLLASTVSEAVWTTITLIDGIWVDDQVQDDQLPGWRLMEVDRQTGELTGREVAALHESLREVDPEGVDGAPLF